MKRIIVVFLLNLFSLPGFSNIPTKVSFEYISQENGLSHNNVQCITQDRLGYLWFGTYDGLNRFNGYSFDVFKSELSDTSGLRDSNIYSMLVDSKGYLWIGTKYGGVSRFDHESETFVTWSTDQGNTISNNWVLCLHEDKQRKLWLGTGNGLVSATINEDGLLVQNSFITYGADPVNPLKIHKINPQSENRMWLSTSKGLMIFDKEEQEIVQRYYVEPVGIGSNNDVTADILPDQNIFLLGSSTGLYHVVDNKFTKAKFLLDGDVSVVDDPVNAILKDSYQQMWIGTNSGLVLKDQGTNKITIINSENNGNNYLSRNHVQAIFEDHQGIIWIGTLDGGINKYDPGKTKFRSYLNQINHATSQDGRSFKSAFQDRAGYIWIGTDGGLAQFEKEGKLFTKVRSYESKDSGGDLSGGGITAIAEDKKGQLFISHWGGGLNTLDPQTNKVVRHAYDNTESLTNNEQLSCCITSMTLDREDRLWIGTIYGFLECYDPETNKFESFKIGEWIWDIEINEENSQIWCATENGLCVLDLASKEKHCFQRDPKNTKSISHNRTWTIFQDSKLQMWVGTYNGLELYREGDQGFLLFNDPSQQSLSIYSIQEDQHGKLWLGTQQGISKFDPSTTTFQHFTKEDGAFPNAKWSYKDRQGLMYFGGVNGVNVFNPEEIQINHEAPTLVFTDFKIFNESIDPSESAALRKPISSADQIHLKYWQNVFSIEFAALNFTSSQKNSYAYKLEGFSDTWTHIGNERTASYTNLDHGQYTFHVIGANNDKVWNDASISIIINIAPPFWDTWWFRTLLVFTLLSFIVAWIKVRTNMIKLKKKELEELVVIRTSELQLANTTLEKQKAEISLKNQDLKDMAIQVEKSSQMKINFFTNISHELRTPLSLILAPLEKLSEEFKDHPKLSQVLQMMQSNTVRLLRLINQLLDLSKVDGGFMRLEVAEGSISVFIEKIYESFKFLANRHKISYSFENNLKRPKVFFDPDKLEKILYNVIINAFKFTPEGGSVKVQLSEAKDHPDQIRISVHDTGQGIESNDIERIFDRFAQGENDQTYRHMPGKGIGLALAQRLAELHHGQIQVNSKKGIGTTFDIYLGVTGELFDAEQIVAQHLDALAYPGALENQNTQETQRDIQDTPEKTDSELPKILVVEDHPDLRQFISMELSGYFNVETAADGEEGWSACLEFLPDIILSDVMMPHVSGIELCNRIKSDNRTSHMQVVLLTAKATTEDEKLGLECGADDYILKPFSTQLLQLKVRNLLDTRRRIQEKYKTIGIIPKITSSSEKDEKLIKSAVEIIENNLDNSDLDPSLMSIELGLSRSLLYTKVKSLTGMSVNEFIKDIRLKKAAHILRHYKDVSISEVASKVGFANHSHFTRIFKEQFGTSPKEYISDHSM